jgi:hypothetical protein
VPVDGDEQRAGDGVEAKAEARDGGGDVGSMRRDASEVVEVDRSGAHIDPRSSRMMLLASLRRSS